MARTNTSPQTGFLWVEEGERFEGMVVEVAPIIPTNRTYSFSVPASLTESIRLGHRVEVPIGRRNRLVRGFVVGLDRKEWQGTLQPIASVVDPTSYLDHKLIDLGRRISQHYACPLGQTLKALTPEPVRRQSGMKTIRYARLALAIGEIVASGARITPGRQAVLDVLAAATHPIPLDSLLQTTATSRATLQAIAKRGWVQITEHKELRDDPDTPVPLVEPSFELNAEQNHALERINQRIDDGGFSVTLVFGVSGCGKTEVYIRAIRRVVAAGKQAILLVPEIVLTTQLVKRLTSRFENVAVNHSALTGAQRSVLWQRIAGGEKTVVIGTRSAVFAPCPNLGLICVDEEQESSYKNLQAPRFNVRDVAILRGKQHDIPVVLGSATPSIETWYNSIHRDHYERITIRHRVKSLPMPKVHLVDMRDENAECKQNVVVSRSMERMLSLTLQRGEQSLILMNRRGFANRLYCPSCRISLTCSNCNVGLVVHTSTGDSICHYCRHRMPTPTKCPNVMCGERLVQLGLGTQQVEDVLRNRFPHARIARVDSDTMTRRNHYEETVRDVENHRIDIVVGTQMIAKGLDFPGVSFVGVISAEPAGTGADFRAHERLFQLITQVAGRAGRHDQAGTVVVQTTSPAIPALTFALNHDYESFVEAEMKSRQAVGLPPYSRLARVVLAHPREATARQEAEALHGRIDDAITSLSLEHADVLGPTPCMITRLRGRYRYDLLIRTLTASAMQTVLDHLNKTHGLRTKAESLILDVDPLSLT